jgi:hypothetical protein
MGSHAGGQPTPTTTLQRRLRRVTAELPDDDAPALQHLIKMLRMLDSLRAAEVSCAIEMLSAFHATGITKPRIDDDPASMSPGMRAAQAEMRAGFIDEHESRRVCLGNPLAKGLPLGVDVRTILFGRPRAFFLNTYPLRWSARRMLDRSPGRLGRAGCTSRSIPLWWRRTPRRQAPRAPRDPRETNSRRFSCSRPPFQFHAIPSPTGTASRGEREALGYGRV